MYINFFEKQRCYEPSKNRLRITYRSRDENRNTVRLKFLPMRCISNRSVSDFWFFFCFVTIICFSEKLPTQSLCIYYTCHSAFTFSSYLCGKLGICLVHIIWGRPLLLLWNITHPRWILKGLSWLWWLLSWLTTTNASWKSGHLWGLSSGHGSNAINSKMTDKQEW